MHAPNDLLQKLNTMQSERLGLYRKYADLLLQQDRAFRCFCSREALEFQQQTNDSAGAASAYPGTCLHVSRAESDERAAKGEPYTIRFKSAAKPIEAPDLVYGKYKKAHREDDFIIIKGDGYPTYHFANVVDDHFMEITHVIRGAVSPKTAPVFTYSSRLMHLGMAYLNAKTR